MEHLELCKEAHEMMVKRKWKVLTNDGLQIPTVEHLQRTVRWMSKIVELEKSCVDSGCFRAQWDTKAKKVKVRILERSYIND